MPTFQNVAQTSNYLVQFGLPSFGGLRGFLQQKGIDYRFHNNEIGLLCSSAFLPGSAFAPEVVTGEYQGVVETIPHTRNFTRIKLEFYVDNEYKALKFLEHWIEYISGSSEGDPASDTYYFRMRYPSEYKSNDTRIVKFERDYNRFLEYRFIGLFPLSLNSTRVQYQGSQVLKANVSFSFDRYVCGESSSLARLLGKVFNNNPNSGSRPDPGTGIPYNQANKLNEIMSGTPLLNSDQQVVSGISQITGFDYPLNGDGLASLNGAFRPNR